MLQRTFQMHYHLPMGTSFRNMETMQTFLQAIALLGYHVVALSEYETIYRQGRSFFTLPSTGDTPAAGSGFFTLPPAPGDQQDSTPAEYLPQGVSVLALGEAAKFATNDGHHLWLAAFPVAQNELASSFTCGLAFPAQSNTASIMLTLTTIGFAARTGDALVVFERWQELFKAMWRVWQPLYAHSFAPHSDWPEPEDADVQAAHLPYLYEINFFGSQLVAHSGKERLLQTPAWRVHALDNDSILLIPEFIFVPRGAETKQGELAAQHLGMRSFLRGRYLPSPAPQDG